MNVKDLESLDDYGFRADRKRFEVVSQLTPDEFTRRGAGTYGSVRNTMVHILSAEWGWLARCGGKRRPHPLDPEDYATLESVAEVWSRE